METSERRPAPRPEGLLSDWKEHTVPVLTEGAEGRWKQIRPIPTFYRRGVPGAPNGFAISFFLPPDNLNEARQRGDFSITSAGLTLEAAEEELRRVLPFTIELGRGMIEGVEPTPDLIKDAQTIGHYFEENPQQ